MNQWSLGPAQSVTSLHSSHPIGLLDLFTCLLTSLNSELLKGVSLFLQQCLAVEGVQKDFVIENVHLYMHGDGGVAGERER